MCVCVCVCVCVRESGSKIFSLYASTLLRWCIVLIQTVMMGDRRSLIMSGHSVKQQEKLIIWLCE